MALSSNPNALQPDSITDHLTRFWKANYKALYDYVIGHASEHITGGEQAIPVSTTAATGLCPILDNDDTHYLDGQGGWTTPAYIAAAHATEHLTGGSDIVPVATTTKTGLVPVLANDSALYLDGMGNWTSPAAGTAIPRTFVLYPDTAISPDTNAATLDQTELSTNDFPLPVGVFTVAGQQTERLCWRTCFDPNWDGGTIQAYCELQIPTAQAGGYVKIYLYAIAINDDETYDQTLVAEEGFSVPTDSAGKSTSLMGSFTPNGTSGANTILFEIKRGTSVQGDTYAQTVNFVGIKGLYSVE